MRSNLLIIFCLVSFFACTPEWHLKHAIKKNPSFLVKDTLTIRDTIFTTGSKKDTIVSIQHFIHSRDTVFIIQKHFTVKEYVRNDSLVTEAELMPDTIYRTLRVPYEKIVYKEKKPGILWWHWFVFGFITSFILVVYIFFKEINYGKNNH